MNSAPHTVDEAALSDLTARVQGTVLGPDDTGYGDARTVWNAMSDRYPAVVVQPTAIADVVAAVEFATQNELPIAVKAGGHNVAGNGVCDGGVVVDFVSMRAVEVDPRSKTARVEPGATVRDFDRVTQAHGLAAPSGIVSTTGIGGLTLGGGWGWLSRSYGLAIDNLRSLDVVTADGEVRRASDDEHEDLFWGLRGGGGNFGIVTGFEFGLHEVGPQVLAGVLVYPLEVASEVLRFHREFTTTAPDELCCYASVRTAPPVPFIPEAVQEELIATVYLCYAGDIVEGERVILPLRTFVEPIVDLVETREYTAFQRLFDDVYPAGYRNYWKSQFVAEAGLSDGAIETLVEYANSVPSPYTSIVIEHLGGEISRVDSGATAYSHRDAGYSFNIFSRWEDPEDDDAQIAWTREFFAAMVPHLADGVYVNFLSREGTDRVQAAFDSNYDRLVDVKQRYDPGNLFRVNQNIAPES
ncbi:FAD-binding oxidoreductase [Halobellus captivus]|uniref:FAD-binding oxidoreductase n=1 Tax=Halobellus captivus TaxID=2592614 RepID=UPI0011A1B271|nr:FAD-binding oxidoreductase [Halobellus captivus]